MLSCPDSTRQSTPKRRQRRSKPLVRVASLRAASSCDLALTVKVAQLERIREAVAELAMWERI